VEGSGATPDILHAQLVLSSYSPGPVTSMQCMGRAIVHMLTEMKRKNPLVHTQQQAFAFAWQLGTVIADLVDEVRTGDGASSITMVERPRARVGPMPVERPRARVGPMPMGVDVWCTGTVQRMLASEDEALLAESNMCKRVELLGERLLSSANALALARKVASAHAGDVPFTLHGMYRVALPAVFGAASILTDDDLRLVLPYLESGDEMTCNKLLARMGMGSGVAVGRTTPDCHLGALGWTDGKPSMSLALLRARIDELFSTSPKYAYGALRAMGYAGREFHPGKGYPFGSTSPILAYAKWVQSVFEG